MLPGDGPGDVSGGLGVVVEEPRVQRLRATFRCRDVRDDDVVVELWFEVPVRYVAVGGGPDTIGLPCIGTSADREPVILEVRDGGVRSRV